MLPHDLKQKLSLRPIEWSQLAGWRQDSLLDLWPGLIDSTRPRCMNIANVDAKSSQAIRTYLETHFQPHRITLQEPKSGLFTGYFEPEFPASRHKTDTFKVPVYRRPDDLILIEDLGLFDPKHTGIRVAGKLAQGNLKPYFSRKEIDQGALENQDLEIAWLQNPIDAFFMAVQGSGRLHFQDGSSLCLTYDAANGLPYTSIGKHLVQQGELLADNVTMQSIYQWFEDHPEQINKVLWHNQSYIFFREVKEGYQVGATGMQLIPARSLAIDPAFIPFGTLLWVDIEHPKESNQRWQKLMLAQDKGSAIKGPIRGDVYWGTGSKAGEIAGFMQSFGSYDVVLPREA